MTEKKQGVPVQEPVSAEEPAKAGDNNKIWHYNGKFPVVVDYLVFFGIFLLAQGLGTAVAWLAGCKWPDPELLASRRAFQCRYLFRCDVRDARGRSFLPQAEARPLGRGAFLPARAESRAVALGGVLHALDLGRAGTVAEPDARGAERLRARGMGDRDGRGDGPAFRGGDLPRRAIRIDARAVRRGGRMAALVGHLRHRACPFHGGGARLCHGPGAGLHLPAHRFALVCDHTPCNQQRHSLPGADCRAR